MDTDSCQSSFSIGLLFILVFVFISKKTPPLSQKVNMKRGSAEILHLPAGNPYLFEESLCYFTQRGWEHVSFEKLAVYKRVLLLKLSPFFVLKHEY